MLPGASPVTASATCPACSRSQGRILPFLSHDASVNYYRCVSCGHVWNVDKNDDSCVRHVTPLADTAGAEPHTITKAR